MSFLYYICIVITVHIAIKHWMAGHIPNEVEDNILVPNKIFGDFLGNFKAEPKPQECFYTGVAAVNSFHHFGYLLMSLLPISSLCVHMNASVYNDWLCEERTTIISKMYCRAIYDWCCANSKLGAWCCTNTEWGPLYPLLSVDMTKLI